MGEALAQKAIGESKSNAYIDAHDSVHPMMCNGTINP